MNQPRDTKKDAREIWIREAIATGATAKEASESFDWWWNPLMKCASEDAGRGASRCSVQCEFCKVKQAIRAGATNL